MHLGFRSVFFGFVFSIWGFTDFICAKVKGKSTLRATLSVILRQMCVLLFNVFFWRSVHNRQCSSTTNFINNSNSIACQVPCYRTSCGRCIEPFGGKGHMNAVSSVHQYYQMSLVRTRPKEQMRTTWKNPNIFMSFSGLKNCCSENI